MPYYNFQLQVSLPPEAVAERIRAITSAKPAGFFAQARTVWSGIGSNVFLGEVHGDSFSLQRNISYRNSFLPQIKGKVFQGGGGTTVDVRMCLNPFAAIFMLIWLGGVGSAAVSILYDDAMSLVPLGMFVLGLVLTAAGFFPEAFKAKRLLTDLLREGVPASVI
jgi:hypothetical protein